MSRKSVLLAGTAESDSYRARVTRYWWLSIERYLGIVHTTITVRLGRFAVTALMDTIKILYGAIADRNTIAVVKLPLFCGYNPSK